MSDAPERHSVRKAAPRLAKPGSARSTRARAAAVGAERQRAHPGGERGGGAGAAAAGRAAEVPGIAGDAGERAVADRLPAELGRRRLAEEDRPVLAQPRDRRRVLAPLALRR